MRRFVLALTLVAAVAAIALVATPGARAGLVSKKYEFKGDVVLEMGVPVPDGLRLDHVYFQVPATAAGQWTRTSGPLTADVAISNTSEASLKVGIAVALFDEEGRLVGAASGGTKMSSIKAGRQKVYRLNFTGVSTEVHQTKIFQISVESQP